MVGKLLFSPDADTLLKDVENSSHNKWVLIIVTTATVTVVTLFNIHMHEHSFAFLQRSIVEGKERLYFNRSWQPCYTQKKRKLHMDTQGCFTQHCKIINYLRVHMHYWYYIIHKHLVYYIIIWVLLYTGQSILCWSTCQPEAHSRYSWKPFLAETEGSTASSSRHWHTFLQWTDWRRVQTNGAVH